MQLKYNNIQLTLKKTKKNNNTHTHTNVTCTLQKREIGAPLISGTLSICGSFTRRNRV